MPVESSGWPPVPSSAIGRIATAVDDAVAKGGGDIFQRAEVGILPRALSGEHGMERVVEVFVPRRVEPVAAD